MLLHLSFVFKKLFTYITVEQWQRMQLHRLSAYIQKKLNIYISCLVPIAQRLLSLGLDGVVCSMFKLLFYSEIRLSLYISVDFLVQSLPTRN